MEKQVVFYNSKGQKLVGILNQSKNQDFILIMAHGFSSNKNTLNFVKLAKTLAQKDLSSLRFDFFGHGQSDGLFEDITITEAVDDILKAIAYVKSLGYQKLGLLGSSFGGIASILAAAKTNSLTFLALKSPVSDYLAVEQGRHTPAQMAQWQKQGKINYLDDDKSLTLKYSFIADFDNHQPYVAATQITIPTLIVHGDKDHDVPHSQSEKLVKCLPKGELITVSGADHRYTNQAHAQIMRDTFTNFIDHYSH